MRIEAHERSEIREYWFQFIMMIAALALTCASVGKCLTDLKDCDVADLFLLLISFIFDIIMAINVAAGADFIATDGSITVYMGQAWLWPIYFGGALLSFALFLVVMTVMIRDVFHNRGYGWGQ